MARTLIIFALVALCAGCSDFGEKPAIPIPELAVHGDTTSEGDFAECEIELNMEAPRTVTIIYTFIGLTATPGADFAPRTDTVTIAASDGLGHAEDHVHVGIEILQDNQIELLEALAIRILSVTNATVVEAEAECLILDDDGAPFVQVQDSVVSEGEIATIQVQLNTPGALPLMFDYALLPGSALATSDYAVLSGRDTIPAGEVTTLLQVPTAEDGIYEPTEQFTVVLSNIANGQFVDSQAVCEIIDDDTPSFATEIQPVLQSRCAISGCHGGSSSAGGLSLGTGAYATVLAAAGSHGVVVVPGNAAASSLYFKATSSPQFESRMPPGGPYLSTAELAHLRDWIAAGAPDN